MSAAAVFAMAADPNFSPFHHKEDKVRIPPADDDPEIFTNVAKILHKTPPERRMYEFSIQGQKVMAYSRKDAITRIKHQKRKKK